MFNQFAYVFYLTALFSIFDKMENNINTFLEGFTMMYGNLAKCGKCM